MLKWAGKIREWWRGSSDSPVTIHTYGRYSHKPVLGRALSMVMNVCDAELCAWTNDPEIEVYLNNTLVQESRLLERLEAGSYEIKLPSQNKVWRFFIA